jgi:hypothetical protein
MIQSPSSTAYGAYTRPERPVMPSWSRVRATATPSGTTVSRPWASPGRATGATTGPKC